MSIKVIGNEEAYYNLANAVILTAVEDIQDGLINRWKHPILYSLRKEADYKDAIRFLTEDADKLTKLQPSNILEWSTKLAKEKIKELELVEMRKEYLQWQALNWENY